MICALHAVYESEIHIRTLQILQKQSLSVSLSYTHTHSHSECQKAEPNYDLFNWAQPIKFH